MSVPTDKELFALAAKCNLVSLIEIAAAVHPDKVNTDMVCASVHAAILTYSRALLQQWGVPGQTTDPVEPADDVRRLELTPHELHPLLREGFTRISQVRDAHRNDLLRLRTIGPLRADRIQQAVTNYYNSAST